MIFKHNLNLPLDNHLKMKEEMMHSNIRALQKQKFSINPNQEQ